jgi:hypothetical protein
VLTKKDYHNRTDRAKCQQHMCKYCANSTKQNGEVPVNTERKCQQHMCKYCANSTKQNGEVPVNTESITHRTGKVKSVNEKRLP